MGQQKIKGKKSKKSWNEEKKQEKPKPEYVEKKRMINIIRLVETNVDGDKPVSIAIRKIKGVSFMLSNAIAFVSGFGAKRVSELSDQEMKKLEDIITNPDRYNIPAWLYNRKNEPETGQNRHLTVSRLELSHKMDINRMKKLKTYKGIRHGFVLPVRGQRTRSSFRKGGIVGVKKKAGRKKGKV